MGIINIQIIVTFSCFIIKIPELYITCFRLHRIKCYLICKRIFARESIISRCRYVTRSSTACRANDNLLIIFTCVNGDILTSQQRYMDFISPVVCNNSSVSTVIGHTIHICIFRNVTCICNAISSGRCIDNWTYTRI